MTYVGKEREVMDELGIEEDDAMWNDVATLVEQGHSAAEILDILHT